MNELPNVRVLDDLLFSFAKVFFSWNKMMVKLDVLYFTK